MEKPNVIFILADQHNAKVTGYAGHPLVKTPNLDKLTEEGVRFENAITQNPICTPSRVSFLSGQYCHNHGYYGLNGRNSINLPNVIHHFREHGYRTAAIGKIHCPEYWVEDSADLFREIFGGCSIGGAAEYEKYLADKGLSDLYKRGPGAKHQQTGQLLDGFPSPMKYEDSQEGYAIQQSAEFISNMVKEKQPFFLHLSFPKPHQVYEPSREFWDMYSEKSLVLPDNADYDLSRKAPHLQVSAAQYHNGEWTRFEPRTYENGRLRKLRGYLGCVSQVDYAVGQLIQLLKDKEIYDETIIVYSSDHGDYACEHGLMEKAPGICSDAITRIPLIFKLHGSSKKKVQNIIRGEVVEAVDVTPTLCELAGISPLLTVDGGSLVSFFNSTGALSDSEKASWGKSATVPKITSETKLYKPTAGLGVTEFPWSLSIRQDNFRLVIYTINRFPEYPEGFGELYNLESDPWEMNNLYFDQEHKQRVSAMTDRLLRWRLETTRIITALPWTVREEHEYYTRYHNSYTADGKIGSKEILESRKNNPLNNYL
jgi:arylsulfatase